jgi:hypothetical protein
MGERPPPGGGRSKGTGPAALPGEGPIHPPPDRPGVSKRKIFCDVSGAGGFHHGDGTTTVGLIFHRRGPGLPAGHFLTVRVGGSYLPLRP